MCIESCPKEPPIIGNRIVDLGYVLNTVLQLQYDHLKICKQGKLFIKNQTQRGMGLISRVNLQCHHCSQIFEFQTENPFSGNDKVSEINSGAVFGTMATGSTFSHLEKCLRCMNIPPMSEKMFYSIENKLGVEWKLSLLQSMEAAGIQEKNHAIENKQFCEDGTPWIKVYVDGFWSKRSYGSNFSSLSGMAVIIEGYTKEVLLISVRNRFCSICARAESKNENIREHTCYKNWTSSASAMEANIIVERFNLSEETHGVKYTKFVGDDSSVYAQIKQKGSYGHEVKKLECTNHALKNYGKHLRKIQADTHIESSGRKLLTGKKIELLIKRAKCSIYEHAKGTQNINTLREDLQNGLHHVFRDHSSCREGICNNVGDLSANKAPELKATSIYWHLIGNKNMKM